MMVLTNLEFFLLFVSTTYSSQSNRCLFPPFFLLALTKEVHQPEGKEKLN